MTIKNFDALIKDMDGKDFIENGKPLAVKTILMNACIATYSPQKDDPSGEEKAMRFALAVRLNAGGDVEVSPEEIVLLKKLVGYGWSPLVVGQIYEYLNK